MLDDIAQFTQKLAIEAGSLIADHRTNGIIQHNYKDQQNSIQFHLELHWYQYDWFQ